MHTAVSLVLNGGAASNISLENQNTCTVHVDGARTTRVLITPFLVPVSPRRSRRATGSAVRVSTRKIRGSPLISVVISMVGSPPERLLPGSSAVSMCELLA